MQLAICDDNEFTYKRVNQTSTAIKMINWSCRADPWTSYINNGLHIWNICTSRCILTCNMKYIGELSEVFRVQINYAATLDNQGLASRAFQRKFWRTIFCQCSLLHIACSYSWSSLQCAIVNNFAGWRQFGASEAVLIVLPTIEETQILHEPFANKQFHAWNLVQTIS